MRKEIFLVAYDVSSPRRLNRLYRYLKRRAVYVQYSVCLLEADRREAETVRDEVAGLIDPHEDDVRFYRLDPRLDIVFLGRSTPFPGGVVPLGEIGRWVRAAHNALADQPGVWDKKAFRRRRGPSQGRKRGRSPR